MTRFRSDPEPRRSAFAVGAIAVFALFALAAPIVATVVTTDLFIVTESDPIEEDVYVASTSGRVDGVIDGDLVIFTGDLTIGGTVTGNVLAVTSGTIRVTEAGTIEGSLRATAPEVVIDGSVGGDVAVASLSTRIPRTGAVGRDVIAFGGSVGIDGSVHRDVRGRMLNLGVDGAVGRDVDVTIERLDIASGARIGGDVLYRSTRTASIDAGAEIDGQVVHLPAQANFIFGVMLLIANVVGFLAFIVVGIATLWLFRGTSARAVSVVLRRPIRSLLVGVLVVVLAPLLAVLLAVSLVGLPLTVAILVAMALGLVVGPVPVVTAFGDRILRGRGGLFGAFVLGGSIWRLAIWLIPIVGGLIYVIAFVWGMGAWVLGAWEQRRHESPVPDLLPPAMSVAEDEAWEPPLPPIPPVPVDPGPTDPGSPPTPSDG